MARTTDDHDPHSEHLGVLSVMTGTWAAQSLYTAVSSGIIDALSATPRTPDDVARDAGCAPEPTARLLRFLAGLAIVGRHDDGRFQATPTTVLLQTGGTFRDLVLIYGDEFYQAWGHFDAAVRGEHSAFRSAFGAEHFDYFAQNPDSARRFDRAMAANTELVATHISTTFDFSSASLIVDVGGGNGSLLRTVLSDLPHVRGLVADRDHVVAECERLLRGHTLADRIDVAATDFFEKVPPGGDVYLLSRVLHDWTDQDCVRLLTVCRAAMSPGARLLVIERLLPEDGSTSLASVWDMHMLAVTGGRERTCADYRSLLATAGFRLTDVSPLPLEMNLLVAV